MRALHWPSLPLLVFAWAAYLLFARTLLYLIGFVGNFVVPRTIDEPVFATEAPMAVAINTGLVLLFASHHSLLARAGAKRWVRAIAPPILERSLYVLVSSLLLILVMWQWRALPASVWTVETPWIRTVLWTLFGAGWVLALLSSFRLGHSETFGVRVVLRRVQGRRFQPRSVEDRAMYGVVRHPMYCGFLVGMWATPQMSVGHLQLSALLTAYLLFGRRLEERDLVRRHGDHYEAYRRRVPAFIPRLGRNRAGGSPKTAVD